MPLDENEVLIQFGSRSFPSQLLRDRDLNGLIGRVIGPLREGPATISDLLAGVETSRRSAAEDLLTGLLDQGILTDVRRSPVDQYLGHAFEGGSDLAEASVAVLGAGPLGARVAHGLAQHGIGHVRLADDRLVDDVWRAFAPAGMATADGGRSAAGVVAESLVESKATVVSLDAPLDIAALERAVAGSDLVLLVLERPDLRLGHLVNRLCLRDRRAWMVSTLDGNLGVVGPLFTPPDTCCYNCYRALADAASTQSEMARRYRRHVVRRGRPGFSPGLPAYADILSGYTVLAAVHFLVNGSSFALARVLTCNFAQMLFETEDVLKLPRCPACGMDKASYRPPFSPEVVANADGGA